MFLIWGRSQCTSNHSGNTSCLSTSKIFSIVEKLRKEACRAFWGVANFQNLALFCSFLVQHWILPTATFRRHGLKPLFEQSIHSFISLSFLFVAGKRHEGDRRPAESQGIQQVGPALQRGCADNFFFDYPLFSNYLEHSSHSPWPSFLSVLRTCPYQCKKTVNCPCNKNHNYAELNYQEMRFVTINTAKLIFVVTLRHLSEISGFENSFSSRPSKLSKLTIHRSVK